jgi:RNA polymerase sigma-70 factor (ECF subfamily)
MTEEELIHGCTKYDKNCQRALFETYCAGMMDVCIRYAKNSQEAKEILLNGFKNIFNGIKNYTVLNAKRKPDAPVISFEEWIKKEIILSAIHYMHTNNKKEFFVSSTVSMRDAEKTSSAEVTDEKIIQSATKQMIIKALQQLTPSYRAVYNLHELDGCSHQEISKLLDISEYSSKDSYSKAKFNLRKNLVRMIAK